MDFGDSDVSVSNYFKIYINLGYWKLTIDKRTLSAIIVEK